LDCAGCRAVGRAQKDKDGKGGIKDLFTVP